MSDTNNEALDLTALLQRIEALESGKQQSDLAVERLQDENKQLKSTLRKGDEPTTETPIPKLPEETFTVHGSNYRFRAAVFQLGDQQITATDALADERILEGLVRIGSGVIVEVD